VENNECLQVAIKTHSFFYSVSGFFVGDPKPKFRIRFSKIPSPNFLAPCTELICSGSVSDFVTMSESLDQGAKGWKTHLEIRCFLTCGRVEILTFFCVLRGIVSPVP
jgi:hypothetical protein